MKKRIKVFLSLSAALAFAAAPAYGQNVDIINDSFADGSPANSGALLEARFYTTSSDDALDDTPVDPPVLDFATGGSGRAIHTTFSPVALINTGDQLAVSYTFTTPASVDTSGSDDFRVGLFNTLGAAGFDENISSSSGTPNPILNNLPGLSGEFDINNAGSDLALRTHNVNSIDSDNNGTVDADEMPSGRLLTTTGGFDPITSGPDSAFVIAPNTSYTGGLIVELDADGDLIVTQTLVGGSVNEAFSSTRAVADNADGNNTVGVNTTTFDFLGFSASSGAFGTSNVNGEPDNGIDFTNITVSTNTLAVVPEPGSATLILGGLLSMGVIRRRRK